MWVSQSVSRSEDDEVDGNVLEFVGENYTQSTKKK